MGGRHYTKVSIQFEFSLKYTPSESAEQNRALANGTGKRQRYETRCYERPGFGTQNLVGKLQSLIIVLLLSWLLVTVYNSLFPANAISGKDLFLALLLHVVEFLTFLGISGR